MCSIKKWVWAIPYPSGTLRERDSFASREFGLVENCLTIEEEHGQRLKEKVLEIVETHPTIVAIDNGEAVTDLQLVT